MEHETVPEIRENAVKISKKEKMATRVALSVAEEIVNNIMYIDVPDFSRNFDEKCPEMTHHPLETTKPSCEEGRASFQFQFDNGIVIDVYMFDMSTVNNRKSEDWVVYEVHTMHAICIDCLEPCEDATTSFDSTLLELLQMLRPWGKSPRVASESEKVLMAHHEELKMVG